jgi:hypothetical protein
VSRPDTPPCSTRCRISDNTVHSATVHGLGLHFIGGAQCIEIANLTIWRVWTYGVWGSATFSTTRFVNLRIADCKMGFTWNTGGPSGLSHAVQQPPKRIELDDVLFLGRSNGNPECSSTCTGSNDACIGRPSGDLVGAHAWFTSRAQAGLMLTAFTSGPAGAVPAMFPWPTVQGSYPSLAGETSVRHTTFARYLDSPCGVVSRAIESNAEVSDAVHPHTFRDITVVDVPSNRMTFFHPPNRAWIEISDCVAMDCTPARPKSSCQPIHCRRCHSCFLLTVSPLSAPPALCGRRRAQANHSQGRGRLTRR